MMAVLQMDQGSSCDTDFDQYLSVSLSYITIYMYIVLGRPMFCTEAARCSARSHAVHGEVQVQANTGAV